MPLKTNSSGIIPAHLELLAIYNPTLGQNDERLEDEIVYFFEGGDWVSAADSKHIPNGDGRQSSDDRNGRLRSVGLAKAMVQFSAAFAKGESVDCIETDKSRIVLHNLDGDWWLLASVALTCVSRGRDEGRITAEPEPRLEYSSREVSPAKLLLEQLLKAHSVFLLHHGPALADLWQRSTRENFCLRLKKFWDHHLADWDVLLHGNPAADMYNAIQLSQAGELGVGVGEEAWGSGEREVLEGFAQRTEGLLDIVVSRFDENSAASGREPYDQASSAPNRFLGSDGGVIFSGLNNIGKHSIRAISVWMKSIAKEGLQAYGVQEPPGTRRPRRQRRDNRSQRIRGTKASIAVDNQSDTSPAIPGSIVNSVKGSSVPHGQITRRQKAGTIDDDQGSLSEEMMKYLTLGIYGSTWGIPAGRRTRTQLPPPRGSIGAVAKPPQLSGRFLIGLLGNLEDGEPDEDDTDDQEQDSNWRISTRYLFVRRTASAEGLSNFTAEQDGLAGIGDAERVRAVVYVCQPFIFTFLFDPQTSSLALPLFYRSFHHQLGPLRGPLLESTDPARLQDRLKDTMTGRGAPGLKDLPAGYSLLYDPLRLTVHNTIPSIPDTAPDGADKPSTWNRLEALSVHSQVLNVHASTRQLAAEREITSKTSRAWWIVWMRFPAASERLRESQVQGHEQRHGRHDHGREAILIRKATDGGIPKSRSASTGLSFGFGRRPGGGAKEGSKVMDGIGPDVRPYLEALVRLSR